MCWTSVHLGMLGFIVFAGIIVCKNSLENEGHELPKFAENHGNPLMIYIKNVIIQISANYNYVSVSRE